ncbi:transposase [Streptomyces sp. NPDC001492]
MRALPASPAVVLSVDEKTAMQARPRRHPTRAGPGRIERREFEHRRHGTASIVAALDMHTGQVLVEGITRNDSTAFIRFLRLLDHCIGPALTTHLVLDDGSSHVSNATRTCLAAHPRCPVHYTPQHASWLNQIEIPFRSWHADFCDAVSHLAPGPHRPDPRLHPRLQRRGPPAPLDLRRHPTQSRMTLARSMRRCTRCLTACGNGQG